MLVIQRPDGWYADREALTVWLQRSPETVRKRCPVHHYHPTGKAMYDMVACEQILSRIPQRSRS